MTRTTGRRKLKSTLVGSIAIVLLVSLPSHRQVVTAFTSSRTFGSAVSERANRQRQWRGFPFSPLQQHSAGPSADAGAIRRQSRTVLWSSSSSAATEALDASTQATTTVSSVDNTATATLSPSPDSDQEESTNNLVLSPGTNDVSETVLTDTRNDVNNDKSITNDDDSSVPTYKQLALFVSTTIFIWLSEPLLSLVDTTVVAWTQRSTAVVQLAALGPATTLYDSLLYSTYFLAIATTNQIAKHLAVRDYPQLQRTTRHVLTVAACLGVLCMGVVAAFGPQLLHRMAGSAASPDLLHHAVRYTYIRASVALASVWNMVSQSFLLATLDTATPAKAVLAASVINVVGDLALSPRWGVQGAAAATAASTLASAAILLRAVRKQMKTWKRLEREEQEQKQQTSAAATVYEEDENGKTLIPSTTDNDKDEKRDEIQMFAWPSRKDLWKLISLAGPISFVIWSKVACYGAMTLRCTDFGVVPLATHAIMMRVFFFFSSFGDSVAQAAQSFLPSTLYPKFRPKQFNQVFKKLFVIAATIGVVNSQVSVGILKYLGKYLTSDAAIIQLMKEQTFCFGLSLLCHPLIIALEGTVIASRDFRTLIRTYVVTLGLHFGILKFASASFPAVWHAFVLFQGIRFVNFSARVWKRQRQMRAAQREENKDTNNELVPSG